MSLLAHYRQVIIANELDWNLAHITEFSDPDGVRSGKSGWSFGLCQFDILNNSAAAACLRECGFTETEIAGLKAQTVDVNALEPKLKAHVEVIEKYDTAQLKGCLERSQTILGKYGIRAADDTALLAVADYDNQYHLSDCRKPGYLVGYLAALGRPFTAKDVLDFKVNVTPYGKSHPKDCRRRYDNLLKVMGVSQ